MIGVPLDLGQSRRGVDMGPSAVRVAGLEARLEALRHVIEDAGNVSVTIAKQKKAGDPSAKYLKELPPPAPACRTGPEPGGRHGSAGAGGDHSVRRERGRRGRVLSPPNQKIRLISIDAHTTSTRPRARPAGMSTACPLRPSKGVLGPAEAGEHIIFLTQSEPENCVP